MRRDDFEAGINKTMELLKELEGGWEFSCICIDKVFLKSRAREDYERLHKPINSIREAWLYDLEDFRKLGISEGESHAVDLLDLRIKLVKEFKKHAIKYKLYWRY